jgi:hypothetical protein
LFGDNAYINTKFMATPYSGTKGGTRDAYNFYHSQLRINIECAFGRFVHRWAVFRAPMQQNVTLQKTSALVVACAKLHNFCIDETDTSMQSTTFDSARANLSGAVPMVYSAMADMTLPTGLLGGGHHWDDLPKSSCRSRSTRQTSGEFPREMMHGLVVEKGLKRPPPSKRRH